MENICRLCAKEKPHKQLTHTIEDPVWKIEQKLIDCCRWNLVSSIIGYDRMPKSVCNSCFRKLENCWAFAESVADAQQQLYTLLDDQKPMPPIVEYISTAIVKEEPYDDNQDDWVETSESNALESQSTLNTEYNVIEPHTEIEEVKVSLNSPNIDSMSDDDEPSTSVSEDGNDDVQKDASDLDADEDMITKPKPKKLRIDSKKVDLEVQRKKMQKLPPSFSRLCETCGLKLSCVESLKRHMMIHLGKAPHECKWCGKRFRTTYSLQVTTLKKTINNITNKCTIFCVFYYVFVATRKYS